LTLRPKDWPLPAQPAPLVQTWINVGTGFAPTTPPVLFEWGVPPPPPWPDTFIKGVALTLKPPGVVTLTIDLGMSIEEVASLSRDHRVNAEWQGVLTTLVAYGLIPFEFLATAPPIVVIAKALVALSAWMGTAAISMFKGTTSLSSSQGGAALSAPEGKAELDDSGGDADITGSNEGPDR
jgi:hypothetical protein